MIRKRRALVLTDETARHPFRMSLAPHWRSPGGAIAAGPRWPILSSGDWRDIFTTYCAAFVAVTLFIT